MCKLLLFLQLGCGVVYATLVQHHAVAMGKRELDLGLVLVLVFSEFVLCQRWGLSLQSIEMNSMCKFFALIFLCPFLISFRFVCHLHDFDFHCFYRVRADFCLHCVVEETFYVLCVLSCVPTKRLAACHTSIIWSIVTTCRTLSHSDRKLKSEI